MAMLLLMLLHSVLYVALQVKLSFTNFKEHSNPEQKRIENQSEHKYVHTYYIHIYIDLCSELL